MKQDQLVLRHGRAAEAVTDALLPDHARTFLGPGFSEVAAGINAVAGRAEELRPVTAMANGDETEENRKDGCANGHHGNLSVSEGKTAREKSRAGRSR